MLLRVKTTTPTIPTPIKTLSCGISITLSALVRERRALALNVIEMAWQERNLSQALRLSALGLCLLFWVATVRLKRQRPREIKPEIHYFSMKNRFHTLTLASWKRVHDPSHGRESEGWRLLHLCLSVPPKLSSSQALSVHAWTRLHVSASERLRAWIAGGYERDKEWS